MDNLTNKQYKDYTYFSRYSQNPIYYNKLSNKYQSGLVSHLDRETPCVLYTTKRGDTWDLISLKFYNTPLYYWILCDYNFIQDPFLEIPTGTILRIPELSELEFVSL